MTNSDGKRQFTSVLGCMNTSDFLGMASAKECRVTVKVRRSKPRKAAFFAQLLLNTCCFLLICETNTDYSLFNLVQIRIYFNVCFPRFEHQLLRPMQWAKLEAKEVKGGERRGEEVKGGEGR